MSTLTSDAFNIREKNPDKFKTLEKAMEISHGKVNSIFAAILAVLGDASAEDIVKICNTVTGGDDGSDLFKRINDSGFNYNYGIDTDIWRMDDNGSNARDIKHQNSIHHIGKRIERRDKIARGYDFQDTFLYRQAVKLGIKVNHMSMPEYYSNPYNSDIKSISTIERNVVQTYDNCVFMFNTMENHRERSWEGNSVSNSSYTKSFANIVTLFYHQDKSVREKILADDLLNNILSKDIYIQKEVGYHTDKDCVYITNEEWREFQTQRVADEMSWYTEMPDDIRELVKFSKEEFCDNSSCSNFPLLINCVRDTFRVPCSEKNIELTREAYAAMNYMGIGVVWNSKYDNHGKSLGYGRNGVNFRRIDGYHVGAMLKHVSSSMRGFKADVKRGGDITSIREILVEDLNMWVVNNCRNNWKFFVLNNADEKDYSAILPASKKKMMKLENKNKSRNSRTVSTVSMEELVANISKMNKE